MSDYVRLLAALFAFALGTAAVIVATLLVRTVIG